MQLAKSRISLFYEKKPFKSKENKMNHENSKQDVSVKACLWNVFFNKQRNEQWAQILFQ